MMDLILQRDKSTATSTPGTLSIGGKFIAFTLEDLVRSGPKIHGRTAIPAGTYPVKLTMSPRFKKVLPDVGSVPGFVGVRIHGGNTHADTEGCPLVGLVRNSPDRISNCAPALAEVIRRIKLALDSGEQCRLVVLSAKKDEASP